MASIPPKVDRRPISSPLKQKGSDFNTAHLKYPDNVGVDDSQLHYVAFYIAVPEKTSTNLAGEKTLGIVNNTGQNNVNTDNASTKALAAAGAVVGAAATLSLLKKANSLGGGLKLAGSLTTLGAGVAVGAALASAITQKTQYQRISDAIILGLENVPEANYSAQWEDVELGTLGGVIAGGASSADSTYLNTSSDMGKLALRNAVKIPGSSQALKNVADILGGFNAQAIFKSITKEVPNPFREQIFKQIGFRRFTFTRKFMPKSKAENDAVHKIIEKFKFHMHPDLSDSGLFFKFPSQFDIVYYFNGVENPYLNRISTCVLENCIVKYGDNATKFASFNDGSPVEITMTLQFKELSLNTKQSIKNEGM